MYGIAHAVCLPLPTTSQQSCLLPLPLSLPPSLPPSLSLSLPTLLLFLVAISHADGWAVASGDILVTQAGRDAAVLRVAKPRRQQLRQRSSATSEVDASAGQGAAFYRCDEHLPLRSKQMVSWYCVVLSQLLFCAETIFFQQVNETH